MTVGQIVLGVLLLLFMASFIIEVRIRSILKRRHTALHEELVGRWWARGSVSRYLKARQFMKRKQFLETGDPELIRYCQLARIVVVLYLAAFVTVTWVHSCTDL